ncbi:RNA polymerase sigma factor [Streptomyces sp. NPDC002120]|uniref:RNA polymerase sigma factor n=1 Tax=Streptomyces sp. NPDC002120 TaxID=3364631 RepID=UPI0036744A2A
MTDDEYDAFVRRTFGKLRHRAGLAGNLGPDDAHEVASQLLVELYAHLAVITTEEDARRFVYGRLMNRVIDMWRRHGKRWAAELSTDDYEAFGQISSIPQPESHPDEWLEFDTSEKIVRDVVNSFSEAERLQLRLRLLGYSSAECAQLLGIERGAERTRWSRLKKQLASDIDATTGDREAAE